MEQGVTAKKKSKLFCEVSLNYKSCIPQQTIVFLRNVNLYSITKKSFFLKSLAKRRIYEMASESETTIAEICRMCLSDLSSSTEYYKIDEKLSSVIEELVFKVCFCFVFIPKIWTWIWTRFVVFNRVFLIILD